MYESGNALRGIFLTAFVALLLFSSFIFCFHLERPDAMTVDPEMIVFGGSVTAAHELFEESMYEDLKDFAYPNSIKNLKIRFSKLENPGLFGAASLCYDK